MASPLSLLLLSASPAFATPQVDVGVFSGMYLPPENHQLWNTETASLRALSAGPLAGVRAGLRPIRYLGFEGELDLAALGTDTGGATVGGLRLSGIGLLDIDALPVVPFAFGGMGTLQLRSKPSVLGDDDDPSFHWGVGARYDLPELGFGALAVRADLINQVVSFRGIGRASDAHLGLRVGVAFSWPGEREKVLTIADADADGVPDADDACPDRSGEAPNGCPNDVRLRVVNQAGRGVPGAVVRVDGKKAGRTDVHGLLVMESQALGAVLGITIEIAPETGYTAPGAPQAVTVTAGGQDEALELTAAPGSVALHVSDGGAPVAATAHFEGPTQIAPIALGPDGHRVVVLPPGMWTVKLESESFPAQQRKVEVLPNQRSMIAIDVTMVAAGANYVRFNVQDPAGRPVPGAQVSIDGVELGRSDSLGIATLASAAVGARLSVDVRTHERAGYREREPVAVAVIAGGQEETITLQPKPGAITVVTRTVDGEALDATVRFEGPHSIPAEPVGPKGERVFELPPGEWVVTLESDRFTTEQRTIDLRANQRSLIAIEVTLVDKAASFVRFLVQDGRGLAVPGATVLAGDRDLGRTDGSGVLTLTGVKAGDALTPRVVTHERAGFQPHDPIDLVVAEGANDVRFTLDPMPGALVVTTLAGDGKPVPATVSFEGPEEVASAQIGGSGEHLFQLSPGDWTVTITSESFGTEVRHLTVKPNQRSLIAIEVTLVGAEQDFVRFLVRDGRDNPVPGADVFVGGAPLGRTDAAGIVTLVDAKAGAKLRVDVQTHPRAGYQKLATRELTVAAGGQEEVLGLVPLPGALTVTTRSAQGEGVDARVRFEGPVEVPPQTVGPTGEKLFTLAPGEWKITLEHERFGVEERHLRIKPDQRSLLAIEITLIDPEDETVTGARFRVANDQGQPVPGARVLVDGKELGRSDGAGVFTALGLPPGPHTLELKTHPRAGFAPFAPAAFEVPKGVVDVDQTVGWLPGSILVVTRTADGGTLQSTVSFHGPVELEEQVIDDGERTFSLPPGDWTVIVRGEGFGTERYDISVKPDQASLVKIEVKLADANVEVKQEAVTLLGKILFEPGRADIRGESRSIIDEVAANLIAQRRIRLVEVQGHTDSQGDDDLNLALSQQRVDSVVEALVARGVQRERLVAKGYGEAQPIATNDTAEGREMNRRVEFVILEQ